MTRGLGTAAHDEEGDEGKRRRWRGRVHRTESTRNRRPVLGFVSTAACKVVEEGEKAPVNSELPQWGLVARRQEIKKHPIGTG